MVVQDVPHDPQAGAAVELENGAQAEGPVVVLDHEPRPRGVREPFESGLEAAERVALAAADVEHDDRLGAEAHRVHQRRLDLEVADRAVCDGRVLGVEDDVLAGVGRQPDVQRPRSAPTAASSAAHSATCPWNCGRSGCVA